MYSSYQIRKLRLAVFQHVSHSTYEEIANLHSYYTTSFYDNTFITFVSISFKFNSANYSRNRYFTYDRTYRIITSFLI